MECYCIDLDSRRPEVLLFDGIELQDDLSYFGYKRPDQLQTFDRRIFETEEDAHDFLASYHAALDEIRLNTRQVDRTLPAMLYKRRYLALAWLGEKTFTQRHYRKNWRPGQLFNFHDQVLFVTVRLKKIIEKTDEDGAFFEYHYELV